MRTILLDTVLWDLVLDVSGNVAVASDPYSLAQDAASAIRTFQGECYYDTSLGVPYLDQVLGKMPPLSYVQQLFEAQALSVPGVTAARVFFSAFSGRGLSGQVQVTDQTGNVAAAGF